MPSFIYLCIGLDREEEKEDRGRLVGRAVIGRAAGEPAVGGGALRVPCRPRRVSLSERLHWEEQQEAEEEERRRKV